MIQCHYTVSWQEDSA